MQPAFLELNRPAVILAPMEGVTDAPMRALMTELGGFQHCVSEFFRVSQDPPHARVFGQQLPEVHAGWKTPAGIPVQLQLLGGCPDRLAETAARACGVGAPAIDLNFGCPAANVNRHDGGSTLLKYPMRIRAIVTAVRAAVPRHIPVSAKLRLGWDSHDPIHENSEMVAQGGASWITIHGRTKEQGYAPPAHWEPIGEVRKRLTSIPVVANGDICSLEDLRRCINVTGCSHFMLGRGALADPLLARQVSRELGLTPRGELDQIDWETLVRRFAALCAQRSSNEGYPLKRAKQWLKLGARVGKSPWNDTIGRTDTLEGLLAALKIVGS